MARNSSQPGKRVGGALYLHMVALHLLPADTQRRVEAAASLAGDDAAGWNVVKLASEPGKVSLLSYPEFFDEPFPRLRRAVSIDRNRPVKAALPEC